MPRNAVEDNSRMSLRIMCNSRKRTPNARLLAASEIGGVVLVIDAKNDRAANWYAKYGALPLLDAPLSLPIPLATFEAALKTAGKS